MQAVFFGAYLSTHGSIVPIETFSLYIFLFLFQKNAKKKLCPVQFEIEQGTLTQTLHLLLEAINKNIKYKIDIGM